jgi:flagellar biosynthesis protein FliR
MEGLDLTPLVVGFLVFSRMAAMLMALPVTGNQGVPRMVRMALALPLAAVLYPTATGASVPATVPALVVSSLGEVALGVAMGFAVALFTGAVAMASELISNKIGLTMAQMLDPMTGSHGSTLGALAQVLATGLFFGLDMHLGCVRALAASLVTVPPGLVLAPLAAGPILFDVAASVIALGAQLAGPMIFFTLVVNLSLMVLGRMAPGLQLFFSIGPIVTIGLGLLVLGLTLPVMLHVEAAALEGVWEPVAKIVEAMAGG